MWEDDGFLTVSFFYKETFFLIFLFQCDGVAIKSGQSLYKCTLTFSNVLRFQYFCLQFETNTTALHRQHLQAELECINIMN